MTDQRKDITYVQLSDLVCLLAILTGKGQAVTHRAGMIQRHLQIPRSHPSMDGASEKLESGGYRTTRRQLSCFSAILLI